MIAKFFYSIAGLKQSIPVDDMLYNMSSLPFINQKDKNVADYCLKCAEHGNYPSADYFANLYDKPESLAKTEAEIVLHYKSMVDFYLRQTLMKNATKVINETSTSSDLLNGLSRLVNDTETTTDAEFNFDDCKPELYGDVDKPLESGLMTGIDELDQTTNGFQRGTVVSFCAFTGHGKTTLCDSTAYTNIASGKKVMILSIELPPDMVWKQFETRYMFERELAVDVHNMEHHTLDLSVGELVVSLEPDFKRDVVPNLLIIDESKITKKVMTDYRKINKLFKAAERKMGGLDMVIVDHVGQLELLYPETGNIILKQLTSAAKTFKNENGEKIVMVWAVQCNREGNRRAIRREGQYDLQAIADLNEVERSSSYCVFLYTSDAMKITQETKVSMLKNRLGVPIPVPFKTSFTPSVMMVGKKFDRADMNDIDYSFTEMNGDFGDLPPF